MTWVHQRNAIDIKTLTRRPAAQNWRSKNTEVAGNDSANEPLQRTEGTEWQ